MRAYLVPIVLMLSSNSYSKDIESWQLFTLSGDGDSSVNHSICHDELYFKENIAPLDGEMKWDSERFENLNSEIKKVGVIKGLEIYDILQHYEIDGSNSIIKIIAFKNTDEKYCPFYAWQPIAPEYIPVMSSHIIKTGDSQIVGHNLNVYRGTYLEYFSLSQQGFIRHNFHQQAAELIKNKKNQYIRHGTLDVSKLEYKVKLSNKSDANCCPSGDNYLIKYKILDGKLTIASFDNANSK